MLSNIPSLFASALALSALVTAGSAGAVPLPDAFMTTNNCITSSTANSQTCQQSSLGVANIFAQTSLLDLSATAMIDNFGPYSFYTQANVFYYMEMISSTGVFNDASIPLLIHAQGDTSVGGTGNGFNHNQASAEVRLEGYLLSACAGFGCYVGAATSFGGPLPVSLGPFSSSDFFGTNIFRIQVQATAHTNSNMPTSYAYAFADPFIEIDPAFLALNPEYSLAFSSNVTNAPGAVSVPVPATIWLFGLGLLALAGVTQRQTLR